MGVTFRGRHLGENGVAGVKEAGVMIQTPLVLLI